MNTRIGPLLLGGVLTASTGCDRRASDGPPTLRLGDSVCVQCNMIISDERFATATIVEGPRGPEARLFDDFNCQVNYEVEHATQRVLQRWLHDHANARWLRAARAHFVMAPALRTPMASHTAAFAAREDAESVAADMSGEVLNFVTAWRRLEFAGVCCTAEHHEDQEDKGDTDEP